MSRFELLLQNLMHFVRNKTNNVAVSSLLLFCSSSQLFSARNYIILLLVAKYSIQLLLLYPVMSLVSSGQPSLVLPYNSGSKDMPEAWQISDLEVLS